VLETVDKGERRTMLQVRVTPNYNDPAKAGSIAVLGITDNKADLAMMRGVNMAEATRQLDEKIQNAIRNRKAR